MKWTSQEIWTGCVLAIVLVSWGVNLLTGWISKERNPKSFWWVYAACFVIWAVKLLIDNTA
jgi:putative Ca2+/H+ antiporter (TMEM165/GDT1 family)